MRLLKTGRRATVLMWLATCAVSFCLGSALAFSPLYGEDSAREEAGAFGLSLEGEAALYLEVRRSLTGKYVETVETDELATAALNAMTEACDKYTEFLPPEKASRFVAHISGRIAGIGVRLRKTEKEILITTPIRDTPAFRAGILPGDVLLAVDDVRVSVEDFDQIGKLLAGEAGTKVTVTVGREGEADRDIPLVREIFDVPSVMEASLVDRGSKVGYLRVRAFSQRTTEEFSRELAHLVDVLGARSVVIDLRGNPGGTLRAAIDMCDLFIDEGIIVAVMGRDGAGARAYGAATERTISDVPVAILVDGESASASEVVTGCMQDYSRAVIIGERTYGKGCVQRMHNLRNYPDAVLKITEQWYFTPSGRNISSRRNSEAGIAPDLAVPLSTDEKTRLVNERDKREAAEAIEGKKIAVYIDTQLSAAILVLGDPDLYKRTLEGTFADPPTEEAEGE